MSSKKAQEREAQAPAYKGQNPRRCICVTKTYPGCPVHGTRSEPRPRCPDCGKLGERKGHQECQYPQD